MRESALAPKPRRRARPMQPSPIESDCAWVPVSRVASAGSLPGNRKTHWITRGRLRRLVRTWSPGRHRRRGRLHVRKEPVADVIDAELAVIDLAVLSAAVLGRENLDVL